jgi:hypothetical protein
MIVGFLWIPAFAGMTSGVWLLLLYKMKKAFSVLMLSGEKAFIMCCN